MGRALRDTIVLKSRLAKLGLRLNAILNYFEHETVLVLRAVLPQLDVVVHILLVQALLPFKLPQESQRPHWAIEGFRERPLFAPNSNRWILYCLHS